MEPFSENRVISNLVGWGGGKREEPKYWNVLRKQELEYSSFCEKPWGGGGREEQDTQKNPKTTG